MGIKITPKGIEYVRTMLATDETSEQAKTRYEAMTRTLVHFLQMKEGTIYANEQEILEAQEKGRKTGSYHSGKKWIEVFSPDGRVVGSWHRYLLRDLPFKASAKQSDLLFKVGQEIINGKDAGYRL